MREYRKRDYNIKITAIFLHQLIRPKHLGCGLRASAVISEDWPQWLGAKKS